MGTSNVDLSPGKRLFLFTRRIGGRVVRKFSPPPGELWDRAAGVATEERTGIADLTVVEEARAYGHTYVPTSPRLARVWLDEIPDQLVEQGTLVDMGSGRGRMLLMAAERPFRRIRGVEFAIELHEAALDNLARFPSARMRCTDVASVHGDAAAFEFPDEPLIMYFDNPFAERIMARVLENLAASYGRHPRPIMLVYQQQVREDPSALTNNFSLLDAQSFLRGRTLRFPLRDRLILSPFIMRIYDSPEVADLVGR